MMYSTLINEIFTHLLQFHGSKHYPEKELFAWFFSTWLNFWSDEHSSENGIRDATVQKNIFEDTRERNKKM